MTLEFPNPTLAPWYVFVIMQAILAFYYLYSAKKCVDNQRYFFAVLAVGAFIFRVWIVDPDSGMETYRTLSLRDVLSLVIGFGLCYSLASGIYMKVNFPPAGGNRGNQRNGDSYGMGQTAE